MPETLFTAEDERTVAEFVREWEPTTHPIMEGVADLLSADDYEFVVSHTRNYARRLATWALLATRTAAAAESLGVNLWGLTAIDPMASAYSLYIGVEANATEDDTKLYKIIRDLPDATERGCAPDELSTLIHDAVIERFFPEDAQRIAERAAAFKSA